MAVAAAVAVVGAEAVVAVVAAAGAEAAKFPEGGFGRLCDAGTMSGKVAGQYILPSLAKVFQQMEAIGALSQ